jgi:hypothetical protein
MLGIERFSCLLEVRSLEFGQIAFFLGTFGRGQKIESSEQSVLSLGAWYFDVIGYSFRVSSLVGTKNNCEACFFRYRGDFGLHLGPPSTMVVFRSEGIVGVAVQPQAGTKTPQPGTHLVFECAGYVVNIIRSLKWSTD